LFNSFFQYRVAVKVGAAKNTNRFHRVELLLQILKPKCTRKLKSLANIFLKLSTAVIVHKPLCRNRYLTSNKPSNEKESFTSAAAVSCFSLWLQPK
jgi:hypothetical protein